MHISAYACHPPAISTVFQYWPLTEFHKHWEYFKISKNPILTRFIEIHTFQFPLEVYEIDPFFYVFMSQKYHFVFLIHKNIPFSL